MEHAFTDRCHDTIRRLLALAGMDSEADHHLTLSGDIPLLPSSFHVGIAAQSTIACAALAAAAIAEQRTRHRPAVAVDLHDAERECTGYFTLDGETPSAWAPLSGLYPCADGWVRIHANFDHHRDGALRVLGIDRPAEEVRREDVEAALIRWRAVQFESACAEAGMVVAALRSFEAWDQTPQAKAIASQPPLTIERVGDAPPATPPPAGSALPLAGYRVLDLTRILAGPVCGRTLAHYGADVMLVNSPALPNIDAIVDTSRGKLSVELDLNEARDRQRFDRLLADAHVFVQGYRPGGMAALGYDVDSVIRHRPGIVHVSLSAWGDQGPWRARRGFDSLVQTATGFNVAEAEAFGDDRPRPMPVQILDYASGFLMAFGAEVALLRQATEGGSWRVSVSLAATAHWLRGLGRHRAGAERRKVSLGEHLEAFPSGWGDLRAMPHAARLDGQIPRPTRPSIRPGTNDPVWP